MSLTPTTPDFNTKLKTFWQRPEGKAGDSSPSSIRHRCRLWHRAACLDNLNTIIVVTHDIAAAASVSDHLWLMGRDRNPDGTIVPGARIQETYNLVDRGLCWQKDIQHRQDFADFVREVGERFTSL
jgi:ABC-type nitrate/sulfonate/bicarbonate transport system ATPase subunit